MSLPRLALTIRTADRTPAPNYVGATVRELVAQGVDPAGLHVCVTAPEIGWLMRELAGAPVTLHVPARRLSPNENGLALIRVLEASRYDWVVLLEDDLGFCADFVGSVQRWLVDHARVDRHVYQFFGFAGPPSKTVAAYDVPLRKLRASQAIALRMEEALDFLAWGDARLPTWSYRAPRWSPLGDVPVAWDKFIAEWSLTRWPGTPGLMSHPHFVRHVGMGGSLHGRTVANDRLFAGRAWRYQGARVCA